MCFPLLMLLLLLTHYGGRRPSASLNGQLIHLLVTACLVASKLRQRQAGRWRMQADL